MQPKQNVPFIRILQIWALDKRRGSEAWNGWTDTIAAGSEGTLKPGLGPLQGCVAWLILDVDFRTVHDLQMAKGYMLFWVSSWPVERTSADGTGA